MNTLLDGPVSLRTLDVADAGELAVAYTVNRDHLQPWEPVRPEVFYTMRGQEEIIGRCLSEQAKKHSYFWVLVDGPRIVGRISLNNVVGGAFFSGDLGYWVAEDHQGLGLASAATDAVCRMAADEIGLHRIQAATLSSNFASQRVLERCAFQKIGFAPKYLRINGRWQDHVLFQRILHD